MENTKDSTSISKGAELYQLVFEQLEGHKKNQIVNVLPKKLAYYSNLIDSFYKYISQFHQGDKNKTGRFLKDLEDHNSKYDSLVKSLDESFMLFVVGTGNYGKSTLINALMEKEVADVGILPKTWKIDIFRNDLSTNKVMVKYRDKKEQLVPSNKAKKIIIEEENKRKTSENFIRGTLKDRKKTISSNEAFRELQLKLEREELYKSDIVEMHWGIKGSPILEHFYLVDTPGLTQNIMGEVRNSVQDYYHKADGVIWLLDATAIAASNAKNLVKDLEESLSKVGGKQQQNIIAVLNRIDLIYKNQGEEGVKNVLADAQTIYKGYFRAIIPFSAKVAFESVLKKEDNNLRKISGLNLLLDEVYEAFYQNAKNIRFEKKTQSSEAYNEEISAIVQEYNETLQVDLEKLENGLEQVNLQLEKETNKLLEFVDTKLKSYKDRVEGNLFYQIESFFKIKDTEIQKRFVNENIFETHVFKSILKEIQLEAREVFSKLSSHYVKKIYFTEYPNLINHTGLKEHKEIGININFNRDSSGEDLMTYGSGVAAGLVSAMFLGPLGLLVGGLVSWFARNSVKDDLRRNLRKELENLLVDTRDKVIDSINWNREDEFTFIYNTALNSFIEVYGFKNSIVNEEDWEENIYTTLDKGRVLINSLKGSTPFELPTLKEMLFN